MPEPRRASAMAPGLLWLCAVAPLVVLPQAEQAFRLPQLLAVALGLAMAGAGALWDLRAQGGAVPRVTALQALGAAYFAWRLLSHLAAGVDAQSPRLLAELGLWAGLFWAGGRLAQDPALARRALAAAALGVVVASAWAAAQALGGFGLAGAQSPGFEARAFGSFGNPDFFGGYLALALPLLAVLWLDRGRAGLGALMMGGVCGVAAFALLLSQTRGAWLASALALAAGAAGLAVRGRLHLGRLAAAGGLCLAVLLLWSLPGPHNPRGHNSLERLASVAAPGEAAGGRLFMARVAWNAAVRHPLLGWGAGRYTGAHIETQAALLAQGAHADQPYRYTHDAHCDWLQLAAESGFPALILFTALVAGCLLALWRASGRAAFALALGAGLVGLLAHACLHFPLDVVPSAALFWLALGMAAAMGAASAPVRRLAWAAPAAATLLGLAAAALFAFMLRADIAYHRGMNALALGDAAGAAPALAAATALDPAEPVYALSLGTAFERLGRDAEAETAFARSLRLEPRSPEAWGNAGLALGKQNRLAEAEAALRRSLALNPRAAGVWGNLGKVLWMRGDAAGAEAAYAAGVAADPAWAEGAAALAAIRAARAANAKGKGHAAVR